MIIQSKKVWVLGNWLEAKVEVEDGKITAILPYGENTPDEDYGEKRVVPGFIDIHTHGAYGLSLIHISVSKPWVCGQHFCR